MWEKKRTQKFSINKANVQDAISQYYNRYQNHLTVGKIAKLHHMSTMTLYRKIKNVPKFILCKEYGSIRSVHDNKSLIVRLLPYLVYDSGHLFTNLNTTYINTTNILEITIFLGILHLMM